MRSRSRIMQRGASFQGNASVIWRATHSAVGFLVTLIQTRSLRSSRMCLASRLPLRSAIGAECHHAVRVDAVGLGFCGRQAVSGVYEREVGTTNPCPADAPRERYCSHVDRGPAVL